MACRVDRELIPQGLEHEVLEVGDRVLAPCTSLGVEHDVASVEASGTLSALNAFRDPDILAIDHVGGKIDLAPLRLGRREGSDRKALFAPMPQTRAKVPCIPW